MKAVKSACPVPFDEARLWKGEDAPALKQQLQIHFQNITAAMDCVGCEKCKLWGKLQLLGAVAVSRPVFCCCLPYLDCVAKFYSPLGTFRSLVAHYYMHSVVPFGPALAIMLLWSS